MQEPDVWTKWAAIGTLAASLVALAVATLPPLWRRWRRYWLRPILMVRVEPDKPWARSPTFRGRRTTSVFLRAEVRNYGRSEARNVRAVVQDWYDRADSSRDLEARDLDPSALHWVSLPWGRRLHADNELETRETAPSVNLAPGLNDFVDLVNFDWKEGLHALLLDSDRPRGFDLTASTAEGEEFVLTVVIVADNAKSLTRFVHYTISHAEPHITDVRLQPAPPETAGSERGNG